MRNKKIALAMISALAMAFTFSCGNGCYTADGISGPCSYEVETVAEVSSSSYVLSSSSAPACNLYGEWIEITPATCDKKGVETRICVGDPSNIEMQEKAQLEWSEWNITTAASGGNPAKGERYCFNGNVKIGEEKSEHLLICGSKSYDKDLEFCQNGTEVKDLCDGKTYTSTQFCQVGTYEIKDLCVGTNSNTNTYTAYTENQFCDSRDGRVYKWVKIGGQVWMAENLKFMAAASRCGSENGLVTASNSTCDTYGRLYDWAMALDLNRPACNTGSCSTDAHQTNRQGVCPVGWHIPRNAEWNTLENTVGSATEKWKADNELWKNNSKGTDYYGFSALPGGYGYADNRFFDAGYGGYWWSAEESGANSSLVRRIAFNDVYVYTNNYNKANFYSVRCVKNN